MRIIQHRRWSVWLAALASILVLAACSITSTGGGTTTGTPGAGGTPGATATPTPPSHALAWYQYDASNVPQIWASINGGTATQITHVAPDHSDCVDQAAWSPPVFSPDLTHIVASLGSYGCGDGGLYGLLSTITVSTGAVTPVPGVTHPYDATIRLSMREAGWIDNTTVWWMNGNQLYKYTLGNASASVVGALGPLTTPYSPYAQEGALRGDTFFYSAANDTTSTYSFVLRRFNMTTHSIAAGSINLGSATGCKCSPGDRTAPGFDVSSDGSHIAYQKVSPNATGDGDGVASSQFFYANADGSGASQIASKVVAQSFAFMQLAPNGALVAIANALPSPNSVASASVSSSGGSGDPNMKFYNPDGKSYPVWKWDSSAFWSATKYNADNYPSLGNVEHYDIGASAGSVGVSGAYNPWYTIGS
jgi:hypothetical protein